MSRASPHARQRLSKLRSTLDGHALADCWACQPKHPSKLNYITKLREHVQRLWACLGYPASCQQTVLTWFGLNQHFRDTAFKSELHQRQIPILTPSYRRLTDTNSKPHRKLICSFFALGLQHVNATVKLLSAQVWKQLG